MSLQNLQKEGHLPSSSPQRSISSKDLLAKQRISNQAHETMSQIFKLISDKETKHQGLLKLYEFKVSVSFVHHIGFGLILNEIFCIYR